MSQAIGFDDVVLGRRSIRGFLDKPVPKERIAEIIEVAMRAPSSYNNQCWNFSVVTGEPLDAIRRGNTDGILAGKPDSREFRTFNLVPDEHRGRQIEVAKQLFGATTRTGGRIGFCAVFASSTRRSASSSLTTASCSAATSRPSIAARSPTRWSTPPGRAGWAASSTAKASCKARWCASMRKFPTIR